MDIKQILYEAYRDPVFFAQTFVPHWFPASKQDKEWGLCSVAPLHRGILAILFRRCDFLMKYGDLKWLEENFVYEDDDGVHQIFDLTGPDAPRMQVTKFVLVMIPRGFAKTTCANLANLHNILFQEHPYIAYISETLPHAEMQVDAIKYELENNERIRAVFGNLAPKQREGRWTSDFIETKDNVAMVARGGGQQVRGMLRRGQRPTKWIMDDMEDKESVSTEDRRRKRREWYYGDLEPILDELDESATGTALATLLHPEALATYLERDPRYTVVKFGAEDKAGNDLWYKKGKNWLEGKKKAYIQAGMLHIFYLEYYNQVRAPETQTFRPEDIVIFPRTPEDTVRRAMAWDPAISQASKSDHPAITACGMTDRGIIHFYEVNIFPRDAQVEVQLEEFFRMAKEWDIDADLHGFESISFQMVLEKMIREYMFRYNWFFEPARITHQHEKTGRIKAALGPRYRAGYITHQKRFPAYEGQLLDFPGGKLDGPDSAAMAVSLLNPAAPFAAEDESANAEDQYEPLADVLGPNWRKY